MTTNSVGPINTPMNFPSVLNCAVSAGSVVATNSCGLTTNPIVIPASKIITLTKGSVPSQDHRILCPIQRLSAKPWGNGYILTLEAMVPMLPNSNGSINTPGTSTVSCSRNGFPMAVPQASIPYTSQSAYPILYNLLTRENNLNLTASNRVNPADPITQPLRTSTSIESAEKANSVRQPDSSRNSLSGPSTSKGPPVRKRANPITLRKLRRTLRRKGMIEEYLREHPYSIALQPLSKESKDIAKEDEESFREFTIKEKRIGDFVMCITCKEVLLRPRDKYLATLFSHVCTKHHQNRALIKF